MANVKIVGDAVVLTSTLKLEDLSLVEKVRPKAMYLYAEDENGKKVQAFRLAVDDGEITPYDITEYGITFRKASRDGGFAQITCHLPAGDGDVKDRVAEAFGTPLMNLTQLEEQIPGVVAEINAYKERVLSQIEVV